MATGDTDKTICNQALIALGQKPILSLNPPDNVERAIWVAQLYDPTRRAILEGAPWNCAKRQATLNTNTDVRAVSSAADNGAGLVRLAVASTALLFSGLVTSVAGVTGTAEANGSWVITVVDATHVDLQGSSFANAYVSGGSASTLIQPLFTYANAFALPADFIRFFELPEDRGSDWELMSLPGTGRVVVTDAGGPLDITYVFDLTDPAAMDPLLVETVVYGLASKLALPLGNDKGLKDRMDVERDQRLALARTVSAQQKNPREWDTDRMLRSRW